MKPSGKNELLMMLDTMGSAQLPSIITRMTGYCTDMLNDIIELESEGLIEIQGNKKAVQEFVGKALEIASVSSEDADTIRDNLYVELKHNEEASKAILSLTKDGFVKSHGY